MKKLMSAILCALTVSACPGATTTVMPTTQKIINCADNAVVALMVTLESDVKNVLLGNNPTWAKDLEALIPKGEEAVVCIIDAWASGSAVKPVAVTTLIAVDPTHSAAKINAQAWMQSHPKYSIKK